MNVDIDLFERNVDKKESDGVNAVWQNGSVALDQARGDRAVPNETLVHEKVLPVTRSSTLAWCRYKSRALCHEFPSARDRQKTFQKAAAEDLKGPLAQVFCR